MNKKAKDQGSDAAWGGRFAEQPAEVALRFSASVQTDQRLAHQDVRGSIAHIRMLAARGVVTAQDAARIEAGLNDILDDVRSGKMAWSDEREDVHMNIEATLTDRIGTPGARLHTGRSRNDQVATDMRMWTRDACKNTCKRIDALISVLANRALENIDVLMPGYTHLQRAQPIRLAHHLHAWCEMLERDLGRLTDAAHRMNECPLGAGALAATTFPIDRQQTSTALGFAAPTRNSLDSVSDRDFLVEAVSALANCAVHLSRFSEELVLWSTQEFSFVQMSDAFTTGSSMMPQKKNPDMAELVRGKSGRVIGSLVNLLVMLKGLPLAYNRDMQEDKAPVFDAFDTVNDSLAVLTGAIATATFRADRMRGALSQGFVVATELADWLTDAGVPFRDAHHVVGRLVARCVEQGRVLADLTTEELQSEHSAFTDQAHAALDLETAVERRDVVGGPARKQVRRQLDEAMARVQQRSTASTSANES